MSHRCVALGGDDDTIHAILSVGLSEQGERIVRNNLNGSFVSGCFAVYTLRGAWRRAISAREVF
jgi:hypothetical protein